MYDWGKPLNILMKKYAYDSLHTDVDIQCTANAICQDIIFLNIIYLQALIIMIF